MRCVKGFFSHVSGSVIEKFAVSAAILVIASVTSAHFLSKVAGQQTDTMVASPKSTITKPEDPRRVALSGVGSLDQPGAPVPPVFSNVDQSATASISAVSSGHVTLDPCTGKVKP